MSDEKDCEGCPLTDRRAFLFNGAKLALAMTVLPSVARALDFSSTEFRDVKPLTVDGPLRRYALPAKDGVDIDRGADVIIVRWEGVMYAFDLSCPHQNTALRWDNSAKHFRCPKHHSEYQPNGTFIKGRATRGMDRLAIKREGGQVIVDMSVRYEQDRDSKGWESAVLSVQDEQ